MSLEERIKRGIAVFMIAVVRPMPIARPLKSCRATSGPVFTVHFTDGHSNSAGAARRAQWADCALAAASRNLACLSPMRCMFFKRSLATINSPLVPTDRRGLAA